MAASVLLVVGEQPKLMEMLQAKASALRLGQEAGQVGAIIDAASRDRIVGFITAAEKAGAKILVDGRDASAEKTTGNWVRARCARSASARAHVDFRFGGWWCMSTVALPR